jgi:hypothetical protein|nr:MAG TPA: hypothetical protein [Caudoviricetes sp.]
MEVRIVSNSELLKKLNNLAEPLFKNGVLDIHQVIVIDSNGARIVREEEFKPFAEIGD